MVVIAMKVTIPVILSKACHPEQGVSPWARRVILSAAKDLIV